jgi:predicted Holliday junction resolvase-like endonuclease
MVTLLLTRIAHTKNIWFFYKPVFIMDQKDILIASLQAEIAKLRHSIQEKQDKLDKYTNSDRHKKYYERNKDRVKENAKQYLTKLKEENPEKLKEYRHKAYLRRKERIQEQTN